MALSYPSISVIVTTYNWPEALDQVLRGLSQQTYQQFEVIIADDGSKDATAEVIRHWQSKVSFKLLHCWQPDEGFRAAMARNRAVALASHDYLVFIDGDCIPLPTFVKAHAKLAEKNWFVAGNRVLLNQSLTAKIFKEKLMMEQWSLSKWTLTALMRDCNRSSPLWRLPLGVFRKLTPQQWQGAKTCNLGVWRQDYIGVNGMDENFIGWGFEDSDLVIRLQRMKVQRKTGKFSVPVLHLWHPFQDRTSATENQMRLQKTIESKHVKALIGIEQYL